MIAVENKIIVSVDFSQKEKISSNDSVILLAKEFSTNRRESNAVLCKVEDGNGLIAHGIYLLVHHNRFVENSPHHLEENLYSLAWNDSIFAMVDKDGNACSMNDNIIVEHVYNGCVLSLPEYLRSPHPHKYRVLSDGFGYSKNQMVFCFPHSNYEIVYIFKGVEHRVIKVKKSDIVGYIKNN